MLIYIVRHGETNANVNGYLQGWSNDPLNENGRKLAVITGRGMRDIKFDCCISSPLIRTRETAEIILKSALKKRTTWTFMPALCFRQTIAHMPMGSRKQSFSRSRIFCVTMPFPFGIWRGGTSMPKALLDYLGYVIDFLYEVSRCQEKSKIY